MEMGRNAEFEEMYYYSQAEPLVRLVCYTKRRKSKESRQAGKETEGEGKKQYCRCYSVVCSTPTLIRVEPQSRQLYFNYYFTSFYIKYVCS